MSAIGLWSINIYWAFMDYHTIYNLHDFYYIFSLLHSNVDAVIIHLYKSYKSNFINSVNERLTKTFC